MKMLVGQRFSLTASRWQRWCCTPARPPDRYPQKHRDGSCHSEKIIGDHIGRHPARRDRLVIATKFSGNLYPGDPNGGGSGRKSLINACENSLRRLQTDYIDLY